MKLFLKLFAASIIFSIIHTGCSKPSSPLQHFITAQGDKLYDGDEVFRFISYNIPNLHYVEDNMQFKQKIPFRFPNEFEIRDAVQSVKQSGGRVIRIYTLSVRRKDDPPGMPRHVLAPGEFDEEAFIVLDKCLQIANEIGVRLIIPFVDNWKWWGGRGDYAAFRDKNPDAFWTDSEVIEDFKKTINFVVNRTNTFTGIAYRDDKAILAWETGNELTCPPEWTSNICAHIKKVDPNHLVIDGLHSSVLRSHSLGEPNVDLVTTHHYQKNAQEIIKLVNGNIEKATGKKPYFVGEFGFIDTKGIGQVLDAVISSNCSGALIWSLRPHSRDGGFYWHSEPYGGNLFKSYHWPGFASGAAFDEKGCVELLRQKAFEIQGIPPAEITKPEPPHLLPISDVAALSWQGAAGAQHYVIQRAESETGPWITLKEDASDAHVQYQPLFNDETAEIGKNYFYRIFAQNQAGRSHASNVVAAATVHFHTLVDNCADWSMIHSKFGSPSVKIDEARRTKEDAHRFAGNKGDGIIYKFEQEAASIKIFSFYRDKVTDLAISGSQDGKTFSPLAVEQAQFFSGAGEYDYDKPVLHSVNNMPENTHFIKIQFQSKAELSRIEVKYGT